MKVIVRTRTELLHDSELTTGMHRLRGRVFKERLDWDVSVSEGLEIDQYDTFKPTYLLAQRRPAGRAVGCAQAPQAGLPPRGLPSLTQSGESPERVQLLVRSEAASYVLVYALECVEWKRQLRSSPASYGKTAFVDAVHTDDVDLAVKRQ